MSVANQLGARWQSDFRRRLLRWYSQNSRPLPWRETRDPYRIWVSEIMLQQTQVASVIDYYHRFLKRFPDVESLAAAKEQDVLAVWTGLGYYRRARQMWRAAQEIVANYSGQFPDELAAVRSLPGIGRYTAGAILSLAFGKPAPILEANTLRLFSRLLGLREDPKSAAAQQTLWEFADFILPRRGVNIPLINQAVMELGSQVCTPKGPSCSQCPLSSLCLAFRDGLQTQIPKLQPAKVFEALTHGLVIICQEDRFLVRQYDAGGWWQGLWEFPRMDLTQVRPRFDLSSLASAANRHLIEQSAWREHDLKCSAVRHVRTLKHGVTRYRITLHCFEAIWEHQPLDLAWKWCTAEELSELPLTSTAKKLLSDLPRLGTSSASSTKSL